MQETLAYPEIREAIAVFEKYIHSEEFRQRTPMLHSKCALVSLAEKDVLKQLKEYLDDEGD